MWVGRSTPGRTDLADTDQPGTGGRHRRIRRQVYVRDEHPAHDQFGRWRSDRVRQHHRECDGGHHRHRDDPDLPGQTLGYSITGGADAAKFNINSSTGDLTFAAAPDFESPTDVGGNNIYDVTVQVSDGRAARTRRISVSRSPIRRSAR